MLSVSCGTRFIWVDKKVMPMNNGMAINPIATMVAAAFLDSGG
jgi:hypothetical protein